MSSIEKLLIQGVRSFGPGDEQKAVIKFGSPLTLITGQNGAGKTTVIECLKYITTGQLPPNSTGGGFVHDPKLLGEREVRAVVKLKFKDITSTVVTCHRMLASIQKPRKIEQKTLDSSMEKVTASGEKKKVTSRCGEIDKEMVAHLGVSKAILNTVVFCHQEESTWPLSEGKNLKTKFDDIFASTRYTKALDNIRKFRQEQGHKCKVYETELQYLDREKEKADELQVSLKEAEAKVASCKAEIVRIKSELEPNDERLQTLNDMYEQFTTMEKNIAKLESSKSELVRSRQHLERKVVSPFTGTRSELQLNIDRHASQLERSERRLQELEGKYALLCADEEEVKGQLSEQHQQYGKLETEDKYHQQRIQSRDAQITSMASSLSIPGYTEGPYSNSAVKSFTSKVAKHRKGKEDAARSEKQSFLDREQKLQEQLNELRTNLAQLTESKRMKESSIQDNKRGVAEIKRELHAIGMGGAALEEVERQLQTANEELAEYRGGTDLPSLEEAVRSLRDEKKRTDDKVQTLQGELSRISQQSAARGALETLKIQKRTHEESYQNEMGGLETDLLSLLGVMPGPEEDLERKLADLERAKKAELRKWVEQGQRDSSQLSRLEAQKEGIMKQVSEKKSRVEQLQREVAEVTGESSLPFEEAKAQVERDIEKKLEDISTVRGSQSFFKKSLEKIHEKRVCPACARGFDSQESFESTIKVLSDRLNRSIPTLLPVMKREVEQLQEKQRRLIELKPKMEELSSMQSSILPSLEKTLSEKSQALTSLQTSSSKARGEQTRLQSELDTLRALQPRVGKVSHLKSSLLELDRRISSESSCIGVGGTMRSQKIVNRDLQEAQRSADELNRKLDHKRQEISETRQALGDLEKRVYTLKEEKLELQARLQKREQLVAKKSELTAQIETLDREIKTVTHQLGPVEERLSSLTNQKRELVEEREEVEAASRAEIESLKSKEEDLKSITTTITRYIEKGKDKALAQCREKLAELQALYKKKGGQKKEVEEQKQALQKELANAKVRERELEDNMKLMSYQEEIAEKDTDIRRLKTELRSMGLEKYDEEYRQCQENCERLRKEKAHLEGQSEGMEVEVRNLQHQLDSDMYRNIEKRHRDKLIDLKTTEAANTDQEKYYKALDRAIMRFHTLKMEEINKILKDLWIKTYKGGDIDSIEIRSEDSSDGGATLGQRRVYNYRVVMIKGQTALDMRGRCSAGQKMLASILIRLALAETFCLNCGLLALDEPTTNLDHDNTEGLAHSLIEIIRSRSSNQKNFQLIIITHDEAFVELLGQAGFTECYFKVTKEVGECTQITRHFFRGASHSAEAR